jgi:translocation and assembly module TamA
LLDTHLTASAGVTWTAEQITQEGVTHDYLLLQVPLRLTYDSTDSVFEPRRGLRGSVSVTPTESLGKAGIASFLIGYASGAAYADIRGDGRTILAARALVGAITGDTTFAVPPDQRFYGGGSATVRGFRYQSIGPQFPSGHPTGGTAVDAATVEYRQRFLADWGAALFVDAGQVSAKGVPLDGAVHIGAGAGVRYYSSIGPIRLDLALPVTRDRKGDTFELYIGIGEAF